MTIEQAIKKAIEGGWDPYDGNFIDPEVPESDQKIPKPIEVKITTADEFFDQEIPEFQMIKMSWNEEEVGEENQELGFSLHVSLLDPSFWQSLGRALEWCPGVATKHYGAKKCLHDLWDDIETQSVQPILRLRKDKGIKPSGICEVCGWYIRDSGEVEWLYHWHRLIDHLTEGKSIESFFNDLDK